MRLGVLPGSFDLTVVQLAKSQHLYQQNHAGQGQYKYNTNSEHSEPHFSAVGSFQAVEFTRDGYYQMLASSAAESDDRSNSLGAAIISLLSLFEEEEGLAFITDLNSI